MVDSSDSPSGLSCLHFWCFVSRFVPEVGKRAHWGMGCVTIASHNPLIFWVIMPLVHTFLLTL